MSFIHMHALNRRRRSYIPSFCKNGHQVVTEEEKAEVAFEFFDGILGSIRSRSLRLNLHELGLPQLDLDSLAAPFTETEI